MSNVTGIGTSWNLPNYAGELFTASPTQTPFLSMAGGLSGGRVSQADVFTTGQLFELPTPKQPAISENASVTAPTPTAIARTQLDNVTQIHQETIQLTYAKQANFGKLEGLNLSGQLANPSNDLDWQVQRRLEVIARDVEYSFLRGVYAKATNAGQPNTTRGMIELCAGGTTIDAGSAALTKAMLNQIYREMADNGARFGNMVAFCGSYIKQVLTDIYVTLPGAQLPPTRTVGGVAVDTVITDFFQMGIVWNPHMPPDTILIADMSFVAPVFQVIPHPEADNPRVAKGVLFLEALAKTGASTAYQLYGQIGLDHGPTFLHSTITGLLVA